MATFPLVWLDNPVWFDDTLAPNESYNQIDFYKYYIKIKDSSGNLLYEMDLMEEASSKEEINTPTELSLTISVEDISITGLTENNFIYVYDRFHKLYNIFEIATVTKIESDSDIPQYKVQGYDLLNHLSKELIFEYNVGLASKTYSEIIQDFLNEQSLDNAISTSLSGIDPNILSKSIVYDISSPQTILEALINIEELFLENSVFWVDPDTNILQWKLFDNIKDKGTRIDFDNNLLSIEQEIAYSERVTRLYAFGANVDVEVDVRNPGDPLPVYKTINRPLRMSDNLAYPYDYVDDETGDKLKSIFLNAPHIKDSSALIAWAQTQLRKYYNDIPINYSGSAIELSKASIKDNKWLKLGDKVKLTAPNINIQDQVLYITGVERDLIDINNIILNITNWKKDWSKIYAEQYFDASQSSTTNGFDGNDLYNAISDLENDVEDLADTDEEINNTLNSFQTLTPVICISSDIDPNIPVYVLATFTPEQVGGVQPGLAPFDIVYVVQPCDNTIPHSQCLGITKQKLLVSDIGAGTYNVYYNAVICIGTYQVASEYGVGSFGDLLYVGSESLVSQEPEDGDVYTQHVATVLRVADNTYTMFANCRAKYREANAIEVRESFDANDHQLKNLKDGVDLQDAVTINQLRSKALYLTPVVAAEDIVKFQLLTTDGATVSVAQHDDPICGIAEQDMFAGQTYATTCLTHGQIEVEGVFAAGVNLYAADDGAITQEFDLTKDHQTKIGISAIPGPTKTVIIMDIQGELINPPLLYSRKINNSIVYENAIDYEILSDKFKLQSGKAEYVSGTNLDYSSGTIGVFECNSFKLDSVAKAADTILLGDLDGNGDWSDISALASYFDHGDLAGLTGEGVDDHTQYYESTRIETWLASKTTTNLTEGTNLYWTQTRFDDAFALKTTDDLDEGETNFYYSDTLVSANTDVIAGATHAAVTTGNPHNIAYNDLQGTIGSDKQIIVADTGGKPSGNSTFAYYGSNVGMIIGASGTPRGLYHAQSATANSANARTYLYHTASTGGGESFYKSTAGEFRIGHYGASYGDTSDTAYNLKAGYAALDSKDTNIRLIASGVDVGYFGVGTGFSGLYVQSHLVTGTAFVGLLVVDDTGSTNRTTGLKREGTSETSVLMWGANAESGDTDLFVLSCAREASGAGYINVVECALA